MKNILMVGPSMKEKGGISSVICNFLSWDYPIIFLNNWEKNNWILLFITNMIKIYPLIKKKKIDIVHFHVAQNGSFWRKAILLLLVPRNVKTLFHMHASQFDKFYERSSRFNKYLIRSTLNKADIIVAVSPQWREFYKNITDTTVSSVNNSVSVDYRDYFSGKTKRIITLGEIGQRKGSYDIVSLAKEIYKTDPNIHFELYGNGELEKFADLVKNIPNITVSSWIDHDQFYKVLKGTSFHLLPSYNEGLPMSVLETMAMGIPNITSRVGGIPSLIKHKHNGFLINAGDIEEMKRVILDAFSMNKGLKELSVNARQTICDQFSLENYFKCWEIIYYQL
ncbi:MAG: glycosyltransferase family 4 protein [Lactobacillus sp.]|nr:glycosyltransferase family 4 protein [Lactobacillus sp.]